MSADRGNLIRSVTAAAVSYLEAQNGVVYPIAHAVAADGRFLYFGAYAEGACVDIPAAIAKLRAALRRAKIRACALLYAIETDSARDMLCIEFESLDAAPETIYVPYAVQRRPLRRPAITTGAAVHTTGRTTVFAR